MNKTDFLKPDFYITGASTYAEGAAALANEARYNGGKGKPTVFIVLMPEVESRHDRRDDEADALNSAAAGGKLRKGETILVIKKGRIACNLIVGTVLDRIRAGKTEFRVFVDKGMPNAKAITNELRTLFESMKVPSGFMVQLVDADSNGFNTDAPQPVRRKKAEVVHLRAVNSD